MKNEINTVEMNSNKLKQFINYMRKHIQDDAEAYDEILCLTENNGEAFVAKINERYECDLNKEFGSDAEVCELAREFADNYY